MKHRLLLTFLLCFALGFVFTGRVCAQNSPDEPRVGIDEKLGGYIPLDLTFLDSTGKQVTLEELVDKPTIITYVYFECGDICPRILGGVAEVVDKLQMEPGEDYNLIAISFDPEDTPKDAYMMKQNFLEASDRDLPQEAWQFLTGDAQNIRKVTDAAGFEFKKEKIGFSHPASLIVIAPDGMITRYIYGVTFLPFDVKMALVEASEGRTGSTVGRVLLYCFSYDPTGKKYVFNLLKVVGTLTMLFAIALFLFLVITGRRYRRKAE